MPDKAAAVLDIGTNSFHFLLASVNEQNELKPLIRLREVIRITRSDGNGRVFIQKENVDRAVEFIQKAAETAASKGVSLKQIATAALREAEDSTYFIDKVHSETGEYIDIISGDEEAEYVYKGIIAGLPAAERDKKYFCIDSGGGSSELIYGSGGRALDFISLQLGAVRLSEKFFPGFLLDDEQVRRAGEYVAGQLKESVQPLTASGFDRIIACGGTASSIAYMAKALEGQDYREHGAYFIEKNIFHTIASQVMNARSADERKKIAGLEEKRADIIPGGILIFKILFQLLQPAGFLYSPYSLKEGVILDEIENSLERN